MPAFPQTPSSSTAAHIFSALELHRQLPFTTSSTIKKRKMSRPEDLPRSASPLKRRAPSLPPDDNLAPSADALEDVDMLSVPATSDDVSMADGDPVRGTDSRAQEVDGTKPKPEAQHSPDIEEDDPDMPRLSTGLDANRSSVEETQIGSEPDEDAPGVGARPADEAQGQGLEQEHGSDSSHVSSDRKAQGQKEPSSSEDAADSDAKTVDTLGTSTSVEPLNQTRWSKRNSFIFNASC